MNTVNLDPKQTAPDEAAQIAAEQVAKANAAAMALASTINTSSPLQGRVVDRLQLHHAIGKHQALLGQTDALNWRDHLKAVGLDAGAEAIDRRVRSFPTCSSR